MKKVAPLALLLVLAVASPIVARQIDITTNGVLLKESRQEDLNNVMKEHLNKAKQTGKIIFPDCKEFSVPIKISVERPLLPMTLSTVTISSTVTCLYRATR